MERLKYIIYLILILWAVVAVYSFNTDDAELTSDSYADSYATLNEVSPMPNYELPDIEEEIDEVVVESSEETEEEPDNKEEDVTEPEDPTEVSAEEVVPATEEEDEYITFEVSHEEEQAMTQILSESLFRIGDVSFDADSKTYTLIPTQPELIDDINYALEGDLEEEWVELTYGLDELSFTLTEVLSPGYSIELQHPYSGETLYEVEDGAVLYDVTNDN